MTFEDLMNDIKATKQERKKCAMLLAMLRMKQIFKFLNSENVYEILS